MIESYYLCAFELLCEYLFHVFMYLQTGRHFFHFISYYQNRLQWCTILGTSWFRFRFQENSKVWFRFPLIPFRFQFQPQNLDCCRYPIFPKPWFQFQFQGLNAWLQFRFWFQHNSVFSISIPIPGKNTVIPESILIPESESCITASYLYVWLNTSNFKESLTNCLINWYPMKPSRNVLHLFIPM